MAGKIIRIIYTVLLVPVAVAAVMALSSELKSAVVRPSVIVFGLDEGLVWFVGAAVLFLLTLVAAIPRTLYSVGHELTHAAAGILCCAEVSGLSAGLHGGKVSVSSKNPIVVLSPYFVPFYSMLLMGVYKLCALIGLVPSSGFVFNVFAGMLGFTWMFHVAMTLVILRRGQSDLKIHGTVFSLLLIGIMNCAVLALIFGMVLQKFYFGNFFHGTIFHTRGIIAAVTGWIW